MVHWQDSPRLVPSKSRPRPPLSWSPTVMGMLGTLLLHAWLIPSALVGSRARTHPPEIQVPSALARSNAEPTENLVLLSLPTIPSSDRAGEVDLPLPTLSKLARVAPVPEPPALLNLESLSPDEDQASQAAVDAGDGAEQARLFGLYTGQIQARIDRIWSRPRTPVNEGDGQGQSSADESFQCRAQIVQDAEGHIQEILLVSCNGSFAWQRSLVVAIQQASPLPAPPSASVFSRSITLSFVGLSYVQGSPDDEYEPASAQGAQSQ